MGRPKREGPKPPLPYPLRVWYYEDAEGVALLKELAAVREDSVSKVLRQLVREEAARERRKQGKQP